MLEESGKKTDRKKFSLSDTFKSVGWAFLGVQSNKNRKRDFNEGKFSQFVVVGLISVVLFVIGLVSVVSMVIPT